MKIIQIMPADGWAGTYKQPHCDEPLYLPLACWALVLDDDGTTSIHGVDCDTPAITPVKGYDPFSFADEAANFCGYEKFRPNGTLFEINDPDIKKEQP